MCQDLDFQQIQRLIRKTRFHATRIDLGMDYPKTKRLFKRIEIAIAMQKFVARFETEAGDEAINRSADRISLVTQFSIVESRCDSQILAACLEEMKSKQLVANFDEHIGIANTL